MPRVLRTQSDLRKHRQRVEIGGTVYRVVFTWRQRTEAWYMDLYTSDGDAIALGRRLSAGWSPLDPVTDPRIPGGVLVVEGEDGYQRADLGGDLRVLYFEDRP